MRNLSFLGILIEEGFIAQKRCDANSHLASLGMTAKGVSQQPAERDEVQIVAPVAALQKIAQESQNLSASNVADPPAASKRKKRAPLMN